MQCANCGNETGSKSKYCSVACKSQYFRNQRKFEETPKQSRVVRAIDEADIIESFKNGEMQEQDAVNEFQSQWELANPQPKEGYREWSAQRAKAVDAFHERLIRSKPRVFQSQPTQSQILSQPTITEVAEIRAMELRGEIPAQTQTHQTPFYEPEQPAIFSQPQQPTIPVQQTPRSLSFNIVESLKSAFSRFFPRKQQQMPDRPINEYGMPASNYQCFTCGGAWLNNRGEVTMHLVEGHNVKYIPQ